MSEGDIGVRRNEIMSYIRALRHARGFNCLKPHPADSRRNEPRGPRVKINDIARNKISVHLALSCRSNDVTEMFASARRLGIIRHQGMHGHSLNRALLPSPGIQRHRRNYLHDGLIVLMAAECNYRG